MEGGARGLIPLVRLFTNQDLHDRLKRAGFEIAHSWQPGKGKAVFIGAKRIT